jgi:hypothetical protein
MVGLRINTITFDTHATAKRYKAAGFSGDQVEALVERARETAAMRMFPSWRDQRKR